MGHTDSRSHQGIVRQLNTLLASKGKVLYRLRRKNMRNPYVLLHVESGQIERLTFEEIETYAKHTLLPRNA